MAVQVTSTDKIGREHGIKCLVYGRAGVGKTVLCSTAPRPLIISAESGLLSLAGKRVSVIEVKTLKDIEDAYTFCTNPRNAQYIDTICLDSISEIAETVLANAKRGHRADGRQAYGKLVEDMLPMVKGFRDIRGKHVVITAKEGTTKDEITGATTFGPDTPGRELPKQLPYLFDLVMRLKINRDAEGRPYRALQTQPDFNSEAKDRSGRLDELEYPDLTNVFNKIGA